MCDYLIVNETELAFFAGQDAHPDDLDALRKQAESIRSRDDQTIIITLGKEGTVCLSQDTFFSIEGRKVDAVDTTAAGDCFVGALATALVEGQALMDAIHFANVAASLSVQKIGASASLPHRQAVNAVLSG